MESCGKTPPRASDRPETRAPHHLSARRRFTSQRRSNEVNYVAPSQAGPAPCLDCPCCGTSPGPPSPRTTRKWSSPYSTSLGCRRQPSLACHAWNHGKSPKSSPLSQQCRFHCHTWSAGESHYCVNSNGFMKFGTHTNEESDEYQQKWLTLSDFVGLCSKYIAIPYGSMAFILKNPSFQITRCF